MIFLFVNLNKMMGGTVSLFSLFLLICVILTYIHSILPEDTFVVSDCSLLRVTSFEGATPSPTPRPATTPPPTGRFVFDPASIQVTSAESAIKTFTIVFKAQSGMTNNVEREWMRWTGTSNILEAMKLAFWAGHFRDNIQQPSFKQFFETISYGRWSFNAADNIIHSSILPFSEWDSQTVRSLFAPYRSRGFTFVGICMDQDRFEHNTGGLQSGIFLKTPYQRTFAHEYAHVRGRGHSNHKGIDYGDYGCLMGRGDSLYNALHAYRLQIQQPIQKINTAGTHTIRIPPLDQNIPNFVIIEKNALYCISYLGNVRSKDPKEREIGNKVHVHIERGSATELLSYLSTGESYTVSNAIEISFTNMENDRAVVSLRVF